MGRAVSRSKRGDEPYGKASYYTDAVVTYQTSILDNVSQYVAHLNTPNEFDKSDLDICIRCIVLSFYVSFKTTVTFVL